MYFELFNSISLTRCFYNCLILWVTIVIYSSQDPGNIHYVIPVILKIGWSTETCRMIIRFEYLHLIHGSFEETCCSRLFIIAVPFCLWCAVTIWPWQTPVPRGRRPQGSSQAQCPAPPPMWQAMLSFVICVWCLCLFFLLSWKRTSWILINCGTFLLFTWCHLARVKRTDLDKARTFVGTCPDMCPEKERYMRETRSQLSVFEVIPGTDQVGPHLAQGPLQATVCTWFSGLRRDVQARAAVPSWVLHLWLLDVGVCFSECGGHVLLPSLDCQCREVLLSSRVGGPRYSYRCRFIS